jgi:single-strand DNA-binding protein
MARGVNKVILVGNLGKDPEVSYLPSGQSVTKFSLATSRSYKDKSGEWKEETEWHNIVAWGKTGESVAQYLSKGRQVYVEGRIQSRTWEDKEGKKRYNTDIVADNIMLLGGRGEGGGEAQGRPAQAARGAQKPAAEEEFSQAQPEITDDDIPF